MTTNKHGAKPGKSAPIKKAAGGLDTTTATTSNATQIIAVFAGFKSAIVRWAVWLAAIFQGVAI